MELVDSFGQTTSIQFSDVRKNTSLSDDFFEFVVPEGVDVISDNQQ